MATMILYDRYMRLFGVRRLGMMENPKVRPISHFALPRGTVYHYMPQTETELGPASDSPVIQAAQRLVFIDHVPDLLAKEGNPRPTYKLLPPMLQQYRRENMGIRPMRDYEAATRELLNMVVVNYAMVGQQYRYTRSALARYWQWKNIRSTLWERINQLKTENERHHIVVLDIPQSLPALSDLRKAEKNMTVLLAKVFHSRERLDLLDLWTWLGENRSRTPMGRLDESRLHEVNLLIRRETGFLTINLGVLNSWRRSSGEGVSTESYVVGEIDSDFDYDAVRDEYLALESLGVDALTEEDLAPSMESATGMDPKILQLRFLKMLTKVIAQTNPLVGTSEETTDTEDNAATTDNDVNIDLPEAMDGSEDTDDELMQAVIEQSESAELLVEDVEEELAEELDAPGGNDTDDSAIMMDEDGELIVEAVRDEPAESIQVVGTDNTEHTLTSTITSKIDELVDKGLYTAAQHRRMQRLAESYKTLPNPYDSEQTLEQSLKISEKDLIMDEQDAYPTSAAVRDKSMQRSTVEQMDRQYVQKVMKKDVLNAVMSVQKAGIAVTGYKVEEVTDAASHYEVHRVQLTPVTGKPSTITFRIPIVDKHGIYISNQSRYRHRTQKSDVPIVKVNNSRVALTSYYNKLFVERSQRATFNYGAWIGKQIVAKGLDKDDAHITNVKTADVAIYDVKLPSIYTILATRVLSLSSNGNYWFDYKNRHRAKIFDMEQVEGLEKANPGHVVCGVRGKHLITVDSSDAFYLFNDKQQMVEELGTVEEILDLPSDKAPAPMAEISVFGKIIPIGLALGYLVGLDRLLQMTRAKYRVVPVGTRLQMTADEYAVRFLDETLVLERSDTRSTLLFSGYQRFHREIRQYSRHSFNSKDVYFTVMEANGIGLRYLRELDLMSAMWVDPITESLLKWMKEPTSFIPLLLRAVEMLTSYYVPERVEGADGLIEGLERAKGYERIPGAIYGELVRSIRVYNARSASSTSQVTMKPHDVWVNIVQDPAAAIVDDINPIQNLKQKEIITYGGRGGRSGRSMTADARLYKKEDIGFISEATVDSGDVAVITYMSPNANLTSVRGTVRAWDDEKDGSASLLSTSALISPFSDRDDPKRVNFVNIQQSHVIASEGYRESPISTGYDHVIAHRTDEMFAVAAEQDGEVVEKSDDHLVVAYKDGTSVRMDLSTQYGVSAGSVYPQPQATTFALGDKVKKGDILKYNPGFFKPTRFHKHQVQWKAGVIARTALMEASYTLEDSSAIDDWLSAQLESDVTKVKTITLRFDQTLRNLVKVGDKTDIDSILCTIEDAETADSGLFSEDDLETLRMMSAATPTAGAVGEVSKIEVFYHGDPDDMSDSLRELTNAHDRQRRSLARKLGQSAVSGQVDQSLRIEGEGLELDNVAIKVYITHREGTGIGDKLVFSNQLKSVVGHRLQGINETESGRPINAVFGSKSIMDRIVLSALLAGMSVSVQTAIGEKAAAMWLAK